jgi:hypothetical protein
VAPIVGKRRLRTEQKEESERDNGFAHGISYRVRFSFELAYDCKASQTARKSYG